MNRSSATSVALTVALLLGLLLLALANASPTAPSGASTGLGFDTALSAVTVDVEWVGCASCAVSIRYALRNLEGVRGLRGGESKEQLVVSYEPDTVTAKQIVDAIEKVGYTARVHQ